MERKLCQKSYATESECNAQENCAWYVNSSSRRKVKNLRSKKVQFFNGFLGIRIPGSVLCVDVMDFAFLP